MNEMIQYLLLFSTTTIYEFSHVHANQLPIPQYIPIPGSGIFPTNYNADDITVLTIPEQMIIKEAERLCSNKQCCQIDSDDYYSDITACSDKGYLECLSSTNECVWDCNFNYAHHQFHGINKRKAVPVHGIPITFDEDKDIETDSPDISSGYYTMDDCGTIYEFETNINEIVVEQQTEGQDMDEMEMEMNENNQRRLGIFSPDGREAITSLRWPYYKNVYISIRSSINGEYFRCSGALISPRHVLTAGDCISDGNGNFYQSWMVIAGLGLPIWINGLPIEEAFSVEGVFTFNEWHLNGDRDFDIGILTLDINSTGFGWYKFGSNSNIAALWEFDFSGYPSDKGRVLQRQNLWMDYNGDGVFTNSLKTQSGDMMTGDAGGPVWYSLDTTIYGVASHMVQSGNTGALVANVFTRITPGKMATMCDYIMSFPQTINHCIVV